MAYRYCDCAGSTTSVHLCQTGFVRLFATFNGLFGSFLSFIVPLIIIAFIAPGIAKLGKGSGKMLGIAAVAAYTSTLFAGFLAFFAGSAILPKFTWRQRIK